LDNSKQVRSGSTARRTDSESVRRTLECVCAGRRHVEGHPNSAKGGLGINRANGVSRRRGVGVFALAAAALVLSALSIAADVEPCKGADTKLQLAGVAALFAGAAIALSSDHRTLRWVYGVAAGIGVFVVLWLYGVQTTDYSCLN